MKRLGDIHGIRFRGIKGKEDDRRGGLVTKSVWVAGRLAD